MRNSLECDANLLSLALAARSRTSIFLSPVSIYVCICVYWFISRTCVLSHVFSRRNSIAVTMHDAICFCIIKLIHHMYIVIFFPKLLLFRSSRWKFSVRRFLEVISRTVLRENARPTGGPSARYRIPTLEWESARGGTIYPRYIGCNRRLVNVP